jgi:hypothetical protein
MPVPGAAFNTVRLGASRNTATAVAFSLRRPGFDDAEASMASQLLASRYDTYVEARETVVELEAAGIAAQDIRLTAHNRDNSYAPPVDSRTPDYEDAVERGGAMVVVRLAEEGAAEAIAAILHKRASADPVEREHDYLAGGWDHFDAHNPPDVRSPQARGRG